jgi:hypothetical protein
MCWSLRAIRTGTLDPSRSVHALQSSANVSAVTLENGQRSRVRSKPNQPCLLSPRRRSSMSSVALERVVCGGLAFLRPPALGARRLVENDRDEPVGGRCVDGRTLNGQSGPARVPEASLVDDDDIRDPRSCWKAESTAERRLTVPECGRPSGTRSDGLDVAVVGSARANRDTPGMCGAYRMPRICSADLAVD